MQLHGKNSHTGIFCTNIEFTISTYIQTCHNKYSLKLETESMLHSCTFTAPCCTIKPRYSALVDTAKYTLQCIITIILIQILKTMVMVLPSWKCHCESSHSSFEKQLSTLRPNQIIYLYSFLPSSIASIAVKVYPHQKLYVAVILWKTHNCRRSHATSIVPSSSSLQALSIEVS